MSALKSGQILEATPKGVCEDNKFSEDSNTADWVLAPCGFAIASHVARNV